MFARTLVFVTALGMLAASPAMAQRHSDIVYQQQHKAKHDRQLAEARQQAQERSTAAAGQQQQVIAPSGTNAPVHGTSASAEGETAPHVRHPGIARPVNNPG
jgi:hypothetical protein